MSKKKEYLKYCRELANLVLNKRPFRDDYSAYSRLVQSWQKWRKTNCKEHILSDDIIDEELSMISNIYENVPQRCFLEDYIKDDIHDFFDKDDELIKINYVNLILGLICCLIIFPFTLLFSIAYFIFYAPFKLILRNTESKKKGRTLNP